MTTYQPLYSLKSYTKKPKTVNVFDLNDNKLISIEAHTLPAVIKINIAEGEELNKRLK